MCRSIVIKGLEALLLECALAAGEFGATDRVLASLAETFPGIDWRKTTDYMIGRVFEHGERRAREMDEVAATLREAGIDPIMSEAAAQRQDWESRLRKAGRLERGRPECVEALLDLLVRSPVKS
jgi:3-hydroxyisobutyrate dehydrogenase-like beta-hydroxyacid dehydrogenase